MLPLISTYPLHNLRFLLSESVYRQQHICSNIITASGRAPLLDQGFLSNQSSNKERIPHGPGFDFPHQFDKELREEKTLLIYEHLDLKRCIWQFDAWLVIFILTAKCVIIFIWNIYFIWSHNSCINVGTDVHEKRVY